MQVSSGIENIKITHVSLTNVWGSRDQEDIKTFQHTVSPQHPMKGQNVLVSLDDAELLNCNVAKAS